MSYFFTVSPDFTPDHISGWYIFNTWLQKAIGEGIHLELFNDFDAQRKVIVEDGVDLIYANPFDASDLVRNKGFLPIAKAAEKGDEAIVVVRDDNPAQEVEELQSGTCLASTDDPDVHLMGAIMLEPAELSAANTTRHVCSSYPIVAKELIRGEADVGFFLAEAYDGLSGITRKQLRPLVRSQIGVIHHALMVGPKLAHRREDIRQTLLGMAQAEKGPGVLESLGFTGWQSVEDEDTEFMIDLMETLTWQLE
ncbi:MAG: phosphate/phosphite/phosphonate ABC transporter substrate-binding protein [Sedimenticola sp.]